MVPERCDERGSGTAGRSTEIREIKYEESASERVPAPHHELAIVMQYLKKQGWIKSLEHRALSKRRPVKISELAKPITEIVNSIEKEKIKKSKRPDSSDPEITELHQLILRSCIIFNLQSSIRGESMEKTKTSLRPDNRSRQINLFVMGNITPYGMPGAVCELSKTNRKGA